MPDTPASLTWLPLLLQENNAINSMIVNFTVTALEEHHFSKKYFLRCHNIYGNAEQQLTVVEGM